ncbi:MAG TPA: protein kinase, partial [Streptosporangiaceae bacterium]
HENIAQVFDYGEPADGQPPYLVMELVEGPSLETVLTGGPLDASRTMDIVAQAAAGLQAAHAAGMIHRDIKPGNLLLAPGGTVKITDFGIAHTIGSAPLTASGELIGTPGYLAPERAMGERATPASDLYSLGMLAYECLAGTAPFRGMPLEVALAHRDRPLPPLPPSVGVGVAALVMRLAAKDPARRPNDAAEVAVWAGLLRDGVGVAALQMWPEQPPATGLFQRRTILAYACVAVTAVVVIVLASVIGFASTVSRVAAPAPVSSSYGGGSGGGDATAPPARGSATAPPARGTAASPGQAPAARSVAKRRPASPNPEVGPAVAVADPAGPGPGPGHRKGPGQGPVPGAGPGHGKVKGKGNGQDG